MLSWNEFQQQVSGHDFRWHQPLSLRDTTTPRHPTHTNELLWCKYRDREERLRLNEGRGLFLVSRTGCVMCQALFRVRGYRKKQSKAVLLVEFTLLRDKLITQLQRVVKSYKKYKAKWRLEHILRTLLTLYSQFSRWWYIASIITHEECLMAVELNSWNLPILEERWGTFARKKYLTETMKS